MTDAILDELIRLSGLSPIFARTVVRRAVQRAGVDPDALGRSELPRVLPELERALEVYIGDAAGARAAAIKRELQR
jgi:hypothetical protein